MVPYSRRLVAIGACGLLLAGWLLGSTLSPPVAQTQARAATRGPTAPLPALTITRLDQLAGAAPRPSPPAPARNPFSFGRAVAAPAPAPANDARPETAEEVSSAIAAPRPEWRLLGLALGADGAITAVLSGAGDVHLVRPGDRLPGDVAVSEVADSGVRLQRADGTVIDLRLP